ncbi:collagen binding domain-containing protein [Clostridium sp. KNHs216]|uniref:collagen binding domain-containing protein n=1 Tax=Clostridium sp. KNHs216 TaxID=1550235 RepID=UPI00116BA475|nr:collagen binding domain-containing protein [Clostridium sp. KNHs216]TQI68490.1 putative repeat protein (TIGR01451 family) [Clostridium sp. KNHs216]
MIKVKNSATALLLAFSMLCSIIIMTPAASAEVKDSNPMDSCITGVDITYTNDSGQHTVKITDSGGPDTVEIQAGTTVGLKYEFTLPDDMVILDEDKYTISLPENLPVADNFKGKTGDIGKLGTYQINDDQTVTLTFNEYAATHESRGGNFYVETSFGGASSEDPADQDIVFNVQGNAVTVPVETVYSVKDPSIEKDGSYTRDSGVTWTVTVHSGNDRDNTGLTDAVVTDTPGDYQDFTGNASLQIGKEAPQPISEGGTTAPYYVKLDNGKIEFHLGDIPANTDAKIVYTSDVSNDIYQSNKDTVKLTNKAELGAENITKNPSDDGTVDVPVDWIYKGGEYDSANKQIEWTIQVNPRNQPLPAGATVTDTLAKFLTLDTDTVQVNGSDIPDKTGEAGEISEKIYYKTTAPDSNGKTKVTFYFAEATDTQQTITFATKIDDKYYNTNSDGFTNTATLKTPNNNEGIGKDRSSTTKTIVGLSSSVISKAKSGSYNPSTHQLSWKITVNSNKMAIADPVVTDTIDKMSNGTAGDHQKIIGVTAVKHNGDPDIPDVPVTLNVGTDADTGTVPFYFIDGKTLTVHLEDFGSGEDPVVLTVVSEVTDPDYYAVNGTHTVYNTAVLTGNGDAINQSVTAQQNVTSEVVEKSALGYHYDGDRLISWQIDVNQNKMSMTNAVITDTIPAGLTLQESTITFNGTTMKKASEANGATPYYTLEGSKLTIHLGNLTTAGTVKYETSVDISQFQDNNKALSYENTANLHFDNGTESGESSTDTQTIAHSVIEKGYEYTSGNLYIDWKVLINRNQVPVGQDKVIKVTDTLQEGLSLDTGSVAFYPVTTSDNGQSFTNGAPVSLTRDNVGYNETTREFVFTFPKDTDLSKAYRLEFRTFVTDKTKSPFKNTVNFQGVIKAPDSTSTDVVITDQSAGGDGWGTLPLGSITVLKQDKKDKTPLSGAEFTLYDLYGNPVQILTTDPTGQIVFSRLSYGTYSLRETKTPDGYKKSTYYKSGIKVSSDSKNITLAVDNTKIGTDTGHSGGGGGGGGSNSDVSSSSASSSDSSSVNSTEIIDGNSIPQAGPGSSSSSNPNETVRDDDVGKSGPSPKTGEAPLSLPALGTVMGMAILTVVVLRKKITKE